MIISSPLSLTSSGALILALGLIVTIGDGDGGSGSVAAHYHPMNVNQNGVWIPNPVQYGKHKVRHALYRFTPHYQKQRLKYALLDSSGVARDMYHFHHRARNLKNAIKAFGR